MSEPDPPAALLEFWFAEPSRRRWFASTPEFDAKVRRRFETLWWHARDSGLPEWRCDAVGCLALVILLDQFPLHMFRGSPLAYASLADAIRCSREAIGRGFDLELPTARRAFLYMPLMHSEELADQELSVDKFREAGLQDNLRFAEHHRGLIRRFGRFPHRNALLGRTSSDAEIEYLDSKAAFTG